MEQPQLGLYIAQLRKQQGLTQEELVEMCNINVRTIQRIENGEVSPRSYTIKNILDALGTSIDEVFKKNEAVLDGPQVTVNKSLIGWGILSGVIYIILSTMNSWMAVLNQMDGTQILSVGGYLVLSISGLAFLISFYMSGIAFAKAYQVSLFKYACMGFIGLSVLFTILDNMMYADLLDAQSGIGWTVASLLLFMYGLGYIFLGAGLFTARKSIGDLPKWTGVFAMLGGLGYATIILFPVGILFTLIFEVMLIVLLYKTWERLETN